MESYLFAGLEAAPDSLIVEGWHKPGSLTLSSGAWMHAAGSAVLDAGVHSLHAHDQYVWFAVEEGVIKLHWQKQELVLGSEDDRVLGGDASRQLAREIPGSELWMYEACGHAAYDVAPDYRERMLRFFTR